VLPFKYIKGVTGVQTSTRSPAIPTIGGSEVSEYLGTWKGLWQ